MRGPGALIVVYERDTAPAKVRRAVEQGGLAINCPRAYDNQLTQFAEAFARVQDLRLGPGVAELLVSRHAGDLSAIANTLAKAAIHRDPGATLNPADLGEPAAAKIPDCSNWPRRFRTDAPRQRWRYWGARSPLAATRSNCWRSKLSR